MISNRLSELRRKMQEKGIDYYIIPTDDYHSSEYVSDFFKCREYMSGFTGSSGDLVVSESEAILWTDGRYFIQAEEQLAGTGIILYRSGNKDVPDIDEYLSEKSIECGGEKGITVGFDGRVMQISFVKEIEKHAEKINLVDNVDLVGEIWTDRPEIPFNPVYALPIEYSGCCASDKIAEITRRFMEKECCFHLISSLDDIAWILNLRGSDIACNPVFMAYLFMSEDSLTLFCNINSLEEGIDKYLENLGVEIREYEEVYSFCENYKTSENGKGILIDSDSVNYRLYRSLCRNFNVVFGENPSSFMKAEKNETEIENLRKANIIDGIAMVKFLKYIDDYKNDKSGRSVSELDAARKLLEFRRENRDFIDISFETISAYGPHGAIVHYEPTSESDIAIGKNGFLLVDSGGQYYYGTTDITRTVSLGNLSTEMKQYYTAVLKGNLDLSMAVFREGVTGANLDVLARGPLWRLKKDYNHGTGHGIGYFLNVHEGPQNINWRIRKNNSNPLRKGMVTSDEPGIYIEGEYGIRIENDVLTVKKEENEYGTFLGFEILTLAPIDLEPVIAEELSKDEIGALNEYHKKVFEKISPFLDNSTAEWLKEKTKPIE